MADKTTNGGLAGEIGTWFSHPVTNDLDWGELLLCFGLFAVIFWVVFDTLSILKKGMN